MQGLEINGMVCLTVASLFSANEAAFQLKMLIWLLLTSSGVNTHHRSGPKQCCVTTEFLLPSKSGLAIADSLSSWAVLA